jgi:heme/copper-type cytochrome/quinol oxidase subunit 2
VDEEDFTNNRKYTIAICVSLVVGGLFGWTSLSKLKVEADGDPYSESYQINLKTWNTTDTWVIIEYSVEDANWTINETEVCSVTVEINKTDDVEKIIIHKVWVNLYSKYNYTTYNYDDFEKVKEIAPGDELYVVGDKEKYDFDITTTNVSDKLGLAALVDITLIDIHGEVNIIQIRPFPSSGHPSTIDISTTKSKEIEDDGSISDDVDNDEDNILNITLFIGIIVLLVVVVLVFMGLFLRKSKP